MEVNIRNYDSEREALRYGMLYASFLLFKTTVGSACFSFNYYVHDAGLIAGNIAFYFVGVICTYANWRLSDLADKIEGNHQI